MQTISMFMTVFQQDNFFFKFSSLNLRQTYGFRTTLHLKYLALCTQKKERNRIFLSHYNANSSEYTDVNMRNGFWCQPHWYANKIDIKILSNKNILVFTIQRKVYCDLHDHVKKLCKKYLFFVPLNDLLMI